ncbi:MAG: pilus assembly protein TadG-related protein [Terracidiphilus sp.]|jgi:hypothetical protein
MKKTIGFFVRKALNDEHGQILPWLAVVLVGLLGTAGLSIDVGRAYVVRSQLQNYANAAALAAAGEVYSTSSTNNASTVATTYSAGSGDQNVNSGLGTVTTTITTVCLNILMPNETGCPGAPANAVKVSEKATMPTYFMKLAGINSLSINSSATASMQGAAQPWNVAIVLDATTSMGSAPPSGSCAGFSTEFSCALNGVETLLQDVNPCSGVSTCSNSNALFRVALFSFPNVLASGTGGVADDWTCGGTPTNEPYTLPDTNLTSYTPLTYSSTKSTYEDTPVSAGSGDANGFVSDYWSGTSSNHLNSSSSLTAEVTGCLKNPGGESTYYGGVIYAAQAALVAEQKVYGGKNAMIFLSDGQANATSAKFPTGAVTPSADGYAGTALTSTGYYPSLTDQCQQAITAAQTANTAGTTVYSVAFNSESTGCSSASGGTDSSTTATATTGNAAISHSTITPCIVMQNIASPATSTASYFYADTSSGSCTDTAHTVNQISTIFSAIAATFTSPRLLPNNAT